MDQDKLPQKEIPEASAQETPKPKKKHLIRPKWLRVSLRVIAIIILVIVTIPVLLYIPPVQTMVKNIACNVIYKSTGMKVEIGKFRLGFPANVNLQDVTVTEASKDTMVNAREVIADVKLLPLLSLDVKIKRLQLNDGYYRMVSPDSSMILKVRAGLLKVDDQSSANIARSEINLHKVFLKDGALDLYMDVWKQKKDTTESKSTPFLIKADNVDMENFRFGMSMLPTIDTLDMSARHITLRKGLVDLAKNKVTWELAGVNGGHATYLTPTPDYIKTHPAPEKEPSDAPPMIIMGDSISLSDFSALYAVRDAKPLAGFDPSYIQVSGVAIGMRDFYNESSTVRLPISRLEATERSGLQITRGSGIIGVDSTGLQLQNIDIKTPYSHVKATAGVPFALMQLEPDAPLDATVEASVGLPDIEAFMPALKTYTSKIPARNPLAIDLDAHGSLQRVEIPLLNASLKGVLNLKAHGFAANPMDIKRLDAAVNFNGSLSDPSLIDKFTGMKDIRIPAFTIRGNATARNENYSADFSLFSDAGDVVGNGHANLNSESYGIDATLSNVNVGRFAPATGIGHVSAHVKANGAGFNPLSGHAVTNAALTVASIEYNKRVLRDIIADIVLHPDGVFDLKASSPNRGLDFDIDGSGSIHADDYTFDLRAWLRDVNLQELGISPTLNGGSGVIAVKGTASPAQWLYNVDLDVTELDWNLPDQYIHLPAGVSARLNADRMFTALNVNSQLTSIDFTSPTGLKNIVDRFMATSDVVSAQIDKRLIDVDTINRLLPPFTLDLNASGRGLLSQFLYPKGMSLDTIYGTIRHDSLISGDIVANRFTSSSVNVDTLTIGLKERGHLLDYRVHMGNRPGTFDEFAQVNLNGYLGANRLAASLTQRNVKGETGYRLGLTAAIVDSTVNVHFTPLKSTIAYLPWQFNNDNFVEYNLYSRRIDANLQAQSQESSILLKTEDLDSGGNQLHAKIDNLKIQDFLRMSVFAPPVTGAVYADLNVRYNDTDSRLTGNGTLGIKQFTYNKTAVGDFDVDVAAGYAANGSTDVNAAMKINGDRALALYANLKADSIGLTPDSVGLTLTRFPIKIANPFLDNMVVLGGVLNGDMRMDGSFAHPILNGAITLDSVTAKIPMAGSTLSFSRDTLAVTNNIVSLHNFDIYGANNNPLSIQGTVNAESFSNIILNLQAHAQNFQPIGNDRRARSDLYGKLFMNLDANVRGPLSMMDINANLNILGTTDLTYNLGTTAEQISAADHDGVVKFVNFNDTTQVAAADSIAPAMNMRITAGLVVSPGTQITVLLGSNGTDRIEAQPTANLNYFQNYMGDMRLNGTVTTGNGFARYAIPVIGEKMFTFEPQSSIIWSGNVMNPTLNITAFDEMKANVTQGGNSRLANFIVTLRATNSLSSPKVNFDLSTNDDLSLQNELQSMSADQRQTQAMNLLLYGQYTGQNTKANANLSGNMLYGFLESQLNSWAAKNIRGVDLSFGIDQYDKMTNGASSTETSYSYQVSKSLFNNRFKIQVGGNYSTDASADENLSQNLISDISLEYVIKQTQTTNMAVRLFRHTGYESILEGEITETGAGFVLKRKIDNLFHLFDLRHHRRKVKNINTDSVASAEASNAASSDSLPGSPATVPSKKSAAERKEANK